MITAIKDGTSSIKEKVQAFSDANQTRVQALLKTLEDSPKQLSSSLQASLALLENSFKSMMITLFDERLERLSNEMVKKMQSLQTEILEMLRAKYSHQNIATGVS